MKPFKEFLNEALLTEQVMYYAVEGNWVKTKPKFPKLGTMDDVAKLYDRLTTGVSDGDILIMSFEHPKWTIVKVKDKKVKYMGDSWIFGSYDKALEFKSMFSADTALDKVKKPRTGITQDASGSWLVVQY
jgi:uncharacterized ubiquitin-like protein YukD